MTKRPELCYASVMKLGKRTKSLVREAMVVGFAEGARFGGFVLTDPDEYPRDSDVEDRAYSTARSYDDLYPLLSKVERDED